MTEEVEYPEVYKVIGAPGTGKTTRVVGNPELELDGLFIEHLSEHPSDAGDYSMDEQMIVTYTRAGTEEAADRLEKMLNVPRSHIDERVTTIHSQCFQTLGVDYNQTVGYWDKKNFCDKYGLEYSGSDDEDDIMAGDKAEGNALFDIYGWLQSNMVEIENWEICPKDWTGTDDVEYLLNEWEHYKEHNNLIGFGDMIEKTIEKGYEQLENLGWGVLFPDEDTSMMEMFQKAREDPDRDPDVIRGIGAFVDTKVLYVDEVQDLTPLQWNWYLLQKLVAEKVFIGGDDDQTIYGWAGANPDFMLDEEGEFEVLDKTYRIPKEIWEVCDGVIQQVEKRQEKEVTPHGDGGEFITMRSPSPSQVVNHLEGDNEDETMILFRARYHIDEFTDTLHEYGIPYDNMSTYETWSDDVVKLRDALAKVYNNADSMGGDELRTLMDHAEDHMLSGEELDLKQEVMGMLGNGVPMEKVEERFSIDTGYGRSGLTLENYLQSTEEINYYQKQAIKGNIKNGNEHMDPERVRIGTIHSSKGKEAETVILATDSTQTILGNMATELGVPGAGMAGSTPVTDAERRVYYVGMTRASQKLVLCQGIVSPDMSIELDALLSEDHSAGEWESGRQSYTAEW